MWLARGPVSGGAAPQLLVDGWNACTALLELGELAHVDKDLLAFPAFTSKAVEDALRLGTPARVNAVRLGLVLGLQQGVGVEGRRVEPERQVGDLGQLLLELLHLGRRHL